MREFAVPLDILMICRHSAYTDHHRFAGQWIQKPLPMIVSRSRSGQSTTSGLNSSAINAGSEGRCLGMDNNSSISPGSSGLCRSLDSPVPLPRFSVHNPFFPFDGGFVTCGGYGLDVNIDRVGDVSVHRKMLARQRTQRSDMLIIYVSWRCLY